MPDAPGIPPCECGARPGDPSVPLCKRENCRHHMASSIFAEPTTIDVTYRNWRGEVDRRLLRPIRLTYTATEWHPEPQWMLLAWDHAKGQHRLFALRDMVPHGKALPAPPAPANSVPDRSEPAIAAPATTKLRPGRGTPRPADMIFRAFAAHTGSGAMDSYALSARFVLGLAAEAGGRSPAEQAAVLHQWSRILTTAAMALEYPANG